ncbi:MAG: 3-methyl-2-oxobutanoate hydroxymethyltransferase [Pseudomonadota bacterium]|nr:3-methyl-2-oxobutanoate hydroxymethyltransferase [Burkholderiales bacterium]MDQ3196884.1 3-methyl-2-oxobutanoate hydroxymethyltransferase [Pseudomonadota bacterium]
MRTTLLTLQNMARDGAKIAALTCYDASFAALLDAAGVDLLLVGDSLGMVLQGHDSTLPVTVADIVYHTTSVARGAKRAFIVADMPFGSYQASPAAAFDNAARFMAAGAHMVKIEGGQAMCETIEFLTRRGIPVCGHLGLMPQSVHQAGGYRVQGRGDADAARMLEDARSVAGAGAGMLVLEAIPAPLARDITGALAIPTIGIGASVECSGQVLVLHDMLDIYPGRKARFVKNFMQGTDSVRAAIEAYVTAVKARTFPAPEHCFPGEGNA